MNESLPPEYEDVPNRLSRAGYLGAASGLLLGVMLVELLAALFHMWNPASRMAEIVWEVGSPLMAILGAVVGSFAFHGFLRDRPWLAIGVFLLVLLIVVTVAVQVVGFPWRISPQ